MFQSNTGQGLQNLLQQGAKVRTAFFDELSENLQKRQAFMADSFTNLVLSGRADHKNLTKAFTESYSCLNRDDIGYKNNLSLLTKLHKDLAPAMHTIEEFARTSWELGFDLHSDGEKHPDYDHSLTKAIVLDGVLLEYCMSSTVRQSIREIATLAWEHLQGAAFFSAGIAHLEELVDRPPMLTVPKDPSIKNFDRQMLSTLYLIRRTCDDLFFDADQDARKMVIGPTGWVLFSVRVLALEEFITHFPGNLWEPINQRYSDYAQRLDFREYKLAGSDDLIPELRFIKALPHDLARVSRVSESKAALTVHHPLLSELPLVDNDDIDSETTKRYVLTPPQHSLALEQTNYQKTGLDTFVILHGQIPTFQVANQEEGRIVRWCIDKNQDVRVGLDGFHIPFDMNDLALSTESFEEWRDTVVHHSDSLMKDLITILVKFPGLYTENFGVNSSIAIVKNDTSLVFSCPSSKEAQLRTAILESPLVADTYDISTHTHPDLEQFIIQLSTRENTTSPQVCSPSTFERLSPEFISTYCSSYRDLLAILKKLGVTVIPGRGSHEGLCHHGRKYTTSKRFREGAMLINRQIIENVLSQLEIPLEQFIESATGKKSGQKNQVQP